MNYLPHRTEPLQLSTSKSAIIHDLKWTVDEIYRLLAEPSKNMDRVLQLIASVSKKGYKMKIVRGKKGDAALAISTLQPGQLYEDPKITWKPSEKQQEILQLLHQHSFPEKIHDGNRRYCQDLGKLRGQMWQLYMQHNNGQN